MNIGAKRIVNSIFLRSIFICISLTLLSACSANTSKKSSTIALNELKKIQPFDVSSVKPASENERVLLKDIEEIESMYGAETGKVLPKLKQLEEILKDDSSRREEYRQVLFHDLISRSWLYGSKHSSVVERLYALGNLYLAENDITNARTVFEKSLSICLESQGENDICAAGIFNSMAYMEKYSENYEKAIELYKKSDAAWSRLAGRCSDAATRVKYNLAIAYEHLSRYEEEIAILESCIGETESDNSTKDFKLKIKSRLAGAYERSENFEKSLQQRLRSHESATRIYGQESAEVAIQLNSLAVIYTKLANYDLAESTINQSLAIFNKITLIDSLDFANSLNTKAVLYRHKRRYSDAIDLYLQCIAVLENQKQQDNNILSAALSNVAALYSQLGQHELALTMINRSIALREQVDNKVNSALIPNLVNLAFIHLRRGDVNNAEKIFVEIIADVKSRSGFREVLWRCQYGLFLVNEKRQNYKLAVLWGKEAVNSIQELRQELKVFSNSVQESFTINKQHVFKDLSVALIERGRLAEAQVVQQMLKEFELFQVIRRATVDDPRITRIEMVETELEQLSTYYMIEKRQELLAKERVTLEQKQKRNGLTSSDTIRLKQIREVLELEVKKAKEEAIFAIQNEGGKRSAFNFLNKFRHNLLSVPQGQVRLQSMLNRPDKGVTNRAVALQYVVSKQQLLIILSAPGRPPISHRQNLDTNLLKQQIYSLRDQMGSPGASQVLIQEQLKNLHQLLIKPVAGEIDKMGASTLVLVPSDVIRYVPFSALYDGEKYLVEKYALTLFNEAIQKPLSNTQTDAWYLVAMGLTRGVEKLPALPAVKRELELITGKEGIAGDSYLNEFFTRQRLVESLSSNYNVLHLASHFKFVAGRPDLSQLYLGDLSTLSLAEIARENLRFDRFKLVTFSACESGLGGDAEEDSNAMDSLGALVQYQGAQSVMATLWKVDDSNTAAFMQAFYYAMGHEKNGRAQSLRTAQLQFIRQENKSQRNPYYWAPFIMMGDWL